MRMPLRCSDSAPGLSHLQNSSQQRMVWCVQVVLMNTVMWPVSLRKTEFCHIFAPWAKGQPCWTEFLTVCACLVCFALDRSWNTFWQNLSLQLLNVLPLTCTSLMLDSLSSTMIQYFWYNHRNLFHSLISVVGRLVASQFRITRWAKVSVVYPWSYCDSGKVYRHLWDQEEPFLTSTDPAPCST